MPQPSGTKTVVGASSEEALERAELERVQGRKLRAMLKEVLGSNPFYRRKFAEAGVAAEQIRTVEELARVPPTTKAELAADQDANPPYGTNLTYPLGRYTRMHQTSGTSGQPIRWLDTEDSWDWFLGCWQAIYRVMGLRAEDRLFFPFSFGPFLGFWGAFEAAARMRNFCLPGGGMSSAARLRAMMDNRITVVTCTPTYALRLAEVSAEEKIDLAGSEVRAVVVAGEPGGSIPATRERIDKAWGARVFDHTGMTEIGAVSVECGERPGGLHVLESEYIAEVIDPESEEAVAEGQVGELVLTNLGRWGSPLVRYRTGDLVRWDTARCACGRTWGRLVGGILGRTDDMLIVRGNNVYPSAIEGVIRKFAEVAEYQVEVSQEDAPAEVTVRIEPTKEAEGRGHALAERVGRAIQDTLFFRAEVVAVGSGTLPRFEHKAKRVSRVQGSGFRSGQ